MHRTHRLGVVAFRVEPAAGHGVPPRLPRYAAPAARDQRRRPRRRPSRRDDRGRRRSGSTRGESTTVSGTVTDDGTPVAGGTVKLLARPVGSHHAHLVGTATTAADGTVSFTDAPNRSTVYRLRLVHSTGLPGALSDRDPRLGHALRRRCRSAARQTGDRLRRQRRPQGRRPPARPPDGDPARAGARLGHLDRRPAPTGPTSSDLPGSTSRGARYRLPSRLCGWVAVRASTSGTVVS